MKKSHRICLIIILANSLILGLSGAIITTAVPVDPSDYTLGVSEGDMRTYYYSEIERYDPGTMTFVDNFTFQLPFGGVLKSITIHEGDKIEAEIMTIWPTEIEYVNTWILRNGSELTSDTFIQRLDAFGVGPGWPIMTTNISLIGEAMSQMTTYVFDIDENMVNFENTSFSVDFSFTNRSSYYLSTGFMYSASHTQKDLLSDMIVFHWEVTMEDPTEPIRVEVDPKHFTLGDINIGDTKTYEIFVYYSESGFLPFQDTVSSGDFTNITVTNINTSYVEYEQVFFDPCGNILGLIEDYVINRSLLEQPHQIFMTTNQTLIEEVFSDTAWEFVFFDDTVEFTLDVEFPEYDRQLYSRFSYDFLSGWPKTYLYAAYEGGALSLEVNMEEYYPDLNVSVFVNPAHYTVGDVKGETRTYKFLNYYSYWDTFDYGPGDFINITLTDINASFFMLEYVIFHPNGDIIDEVPEFPIPRSKLYQPQAIYMTTNTTLINEVFSCTIWDVTYTNNLVQFEAKSISPDTNEEWYHNYTYDLNNGLLYGFQIKLWEIIDGQKTLVYHQEIRLVEEEIETSETTTASTQSTGTEAPGLDTPFPGTFSLFGLIAISVIIIRKRRPT